MKTQKPLIAIVVVLFLGALACSSISNFVATPTPLPTLTPVPTLTPTPIPVVVLFELADFTEDDCSFDSTESVDRFEENGQYHMVIKSSAYIGWSECTQEEFDDFVLETDMSQVSGPDINYYGVIFRFALDGNDFYLFTISGDGKYAFGIDGTERKETELLVDWTDSPAINQGAQTNHVKIVAVGNSILFYVNDQFLQEVHDDHLTTGTTGFVAGSLDEGNVHVSFDNLKVTEP